MGNFLAVIFSYNRPEMLSVLLTELHGKCEVLIIDDGSQCTLPFFHDDQTLIRTIHEGKQGFWKKWLIARQVALATNHDYFLFLPDDVSNIDLKAVNEIVSQGWNDRLLAMNVLNTGNRYRWGKWKQFQPNIQLAGRTWIQCDYVDGAFLTNRVTFESIEIEPVKKVWFNAPDKSSGVGYQMTMKLLRLGCPMMLPEKSLAYHGDHESKMHTEHRKKVRLVSK